MAISLRHQFISPKTDSADATIVQPSSWNADHTLNQAGQSLLGRAAAGDGETTEIPLGEGLSFNESGALRAGPFELFTADRISLSGASSGGSGQSSVLNGTVTGNMIATQQAAEEGTVSIRLMSPLRTAQAIKALSWRDTGSVVMAGSQHVFTTPLQDVTEYRLWLRNIRATTAAHIRILLRTGVLTYTTGYISSCVQGGTDYSNLGGFPIRRTAADTVVSGCMRIMRVDGKQWAAQGTFLGGGQVITVAGVLDAPDIGEGLGGSSGLTVGFASSGSFQTLADHNVARLLYR